MNYISFLEIASELKKTKRTGWVDRGIPNAESVADHSWRVALMALVFAEKLGIDSGKAVKMALVHDLPEAITGDISRDQIDSYESVIGIKPSINEEKKRAGEEKALEQMTKQLDAESRGEISSLWSEFEAQKTKTAVFVKELDNLECLLQALEYKRAHPENEKLRDFFSWHKKFSAIKQPLLKKIAEETIKDFEKISEEE